MQQIPKPPSESIISAGLDWNGLHASKRSVLMDNWRQQTTADYAPTTSTYPEIVLNEASSSEFWEKGWVKPMKTLPEALELADEFPEKFNRRLFYNPKTYACPINNKYDYCLHTKSQMPEGEALHDLDGFLNRVSSVAIDVGDGEMASKVADFHNDLGYLSEVDFDNGSKVIANGWIDYLRQNSGAFINVFDPTDQRPKSTTYVQDKVIAGLERQIINLPPAEAKNVRGRVKTDPDAWAITPGSKLVVLDDWVISGGSSSEFVARAKEKAVEHDLRFDDSDVEVHTIARSSSADEPRGFKYRSVFLQDTGRHYRDVSMTGAHCTVNYGYEHQIQSIQKYLHSKGVFVEAPHLFKIQPSEYRAYDMRKLEEVADSNLIEQIARDNSVALKCLQRISDINTEKSLLLSGEEPAKPTSELDELSKKCVAYTVLLDRVSQRRANLRRELGVPKGV